MKHECKKVSVALALENRREDINQFTQIVSLATKRNLKMMRFCYISGVYLDIGYDSSLRVAAEDNPYVDNYSATLSTPLAAYNTTYTYDAMDRVIKVTNPDGTNKTVTFDRYNITDYDENSHKHTYTLDAFGQIAKVLEYNVDGLTGLNETYTTSYDYDATGNLVEITDTLGNEFKFTYDSFGRKVATDDPDLGHWEYTYDLNGNLISQSFRSSNLETGDGYFREYNGFGQLQIVRNGSTAVSPILEQYWYDQDGQRLKIRLNDAASTTIYTPFRDLLRIVNSTGSYDYRYIYDGSQLVARNNPDGTRYYYSTDHLGSAQVITSGNGSIIDEIVYSPFGEEVFGGDKDVKGYTGQYDDSLTNQMYYGARYYRPEYAQFISPDPIISNVYNPQNLNSYAYVLGNPYKFSDPSGRDTLQMGVTIGGGIGWGGQIGIGIAMDDKGNVGIYVYGGGGAHAGVNFGGGGEISVSKNTQITDLGGLSITSGGSASPLTGPSIGTEITLSLEDNQNPNDDEDNDLKPSKESNNPIKPIYSIQIGGAVQSGIETHGDVTHTSVFSIGNHKTIAATLAAEVKAARTKMANSIITQLSKYKPKKITKTKTSTSSKSGGK